MQISVLGSNSRVTLTTYNLQPLFLERIHGNHPKLYLFWSLSPGPIPPEVRWDGLDGKEGKKLFQTGMGFYKVSDQQWMTIV